MFADDDQPSSTTSQLISIFLRRQLRRSSLIVAMLRSYRRKLRAPSLHLVLRQQRKQQRRCYRSQLRVAHFYVAMGATTRSLNVNILVESGTPLVVKDAWDYADGRGIWSRPIVILDDRLEVS